MIYRKLLLLATSVFMTTCTIEKYGEIAKTSEELVQEYQEAIANFNEPEIELPASSKIVISKEQAWLLQPIPGDYSQREYREVLKDMFPGYPIVFDPSIPDDFNPLVVAPPDANTILDHLNALAIQTNMGWTYDQGVITISPQTTESYPIPVQGSYSSDQGEGITNQILLSHDNLGGTNTDDSSNFDNLITGEISPYEELASLVTSVVKAEDCNDLSLTNPNQTNQIFSVDIVQTGPPCFSISGAANSLSLTARPREHSAFKRAHQQWFNQVNAQVSLVLRVLLFDITEIAQQNLDVSLVRSAAISAIGRTNSSGFVSFDESANGLTFTFDEGNSASGSQLIIQALNQIGRTYIVDTTEFTARNNQVHSLFVEDMEPFLDSVAVQQTNAGATSLNTPTFQTGETITGQAINIIPTITGDQVGIRMILNSRTLGDLNVFDFSTGDSVLRSERPATSGTDITFNRSLRDGQIAMLTSSNRRIFNIDSANNDLLPVVGDLRSAQNRTFTTLYLLEANIVH